MARKPDSIVHGMPSWREADNYKEKTLAKGKAAIADMSEIATFFNLGIHTVATNG